MVGDIYGADYGKIGLKASTIASSMGKLFRQSCEYKNVDICRSLLYMVRYSLI